MIMMIWPWYDHDDMDLVQGITVTIDHDCDHDMTMMIWSCPSMLLWPLTRTMTMIWRWWYDHDVTKIWPWYDHDMTMVILTLMIWTCPRILPQEWGRWHWLPIWRHSWPVCTEWDLEFYNLIFFKNKMWCVSCIVIFCANMETQLASLHRIKPEHLTTYLSLVWYFF